MNSKFRQSSQTWVELILSLTAWKTLNKSKKRRQCRGWEGLVLILALKNGKKRKGKRSSYKHMLSKCDKQWYPLKKYIKHQSRKNSPQEKKPLNSHAKSQNLGLVRSNCPRTTRINSKTRSKQENQSDLRTHESRCRYLTQKTKCTRVNLRKLSNCLSELIFLIKVLVLL